MINLAIENRHLPLYQQIYLALKKDIITGDLPSHYKLPSKRKMATDLNMSINTIDTAYSQLIAEGYIESRPRSGYYVCEFDQYLSSNQKTLSTTSKKKSDNRIVIDFSPSDIDHDGFPFNKFRKILKNSFDEYNAACLSRMENQGNYEFREELSKFLIMSRGVQSSADQIIIGAGTDNLLQILSLIFNGKRKIAMENPLYNKAYNIFDTMGHDLVTIDIDSKGIPIEPLNEHNIDVVYITPSHQFPLGISMPISRRIKLLKWASEVEGRYIIEDDYDSEFRYNSKPIPSLQSIDNHEKVIYIGTFSKSIAPSMRISYMVLPKSLLEIYSNKYSFLGSSSSRIEQDLLYQFIKEGHYETHLNKMRKIYRDKRIHLVHEISKLGERCHIIGENAGHHILVKIDIGLSEQELVRKAYEVGVKVYPISKFFMGKVPSQYQSTILLGYGSLTIKNISKGIQLLGEEWGLL